MKRSMSAILRSAALVAVVLAGGCGDDEEPTTSTIGPGLANPASVFCVESGGTVEIVTENGGEVGYCNLSDGTRVEEWAYFTQMTGGTAP